MTRVAPQHQTTRSPKLYRTQKLPHIRLITLLILLQGLANTAAWALTLEESRHLLSRTGFAPSFTEISAYLPLKREEAIRKRMSELQTFPQTALPNEFKTPYLETFEAKKATREERQAFNKLQRQRMGQVQQWWFNEMLTTTSPFTENLTLFWHNHFVSSAIKVKRPELMAMQNLTLRQYSSGHFGDFVQAILQDPAMLRYLDNPQNKAGKLNENLARELLELFTMGEGNYTEQDIKQVAKALTGYGVQPKTGLFIFNPEQHDQTSITLFNTNQPHTPKTLVDLLLKQPSTSRFITQKLWSHFITTPIPKAKWQTLSQQFQADYQIKPLIHTILSSPEFWHPDNIGTQIKSPVDLVIGLYRQFEITPDKLSLLINQTRQMGQNILFPPNVKGWQTGNAWINTTTLLARQTFIDNVTRGMKLPNAAEKQAKNNQAWLNLLIAKPLQSRLTQQKTPWETIETALKDPAYQLQ